MLEGGDLCTNVPKPLEPASTIVTMPCPLSTFRTRLKLAELVIGSIAIVFFWGGTHKQKHTRCGNRKAARDNKRESSKLYPIRIERIVAKAQSDGSSRRFAIKSAHAQHTTGISKETPKSYAQHIGAHTIVH